jgi:hypothetical protein
MGSGRLIRSSGAPFWTIHRGGPNFLPQRSAGILPAVAGASGLCSLGYLLYNKLPGSRDREGHGFSRAAHRPQQPRGHRERERNVNVKSPDARKPR